MSSNKLHVEMFTVGQMAENCYLVQSGDEAILIDPGDDGQYLIGKVQESQARLVAIIATHGHSDHITAAFEVQTTLAAPFYIHEQDIFFLDRMKVPRSDPPPVITKTISDGDIITIGTYSFRVMHTPGHTPGGISLYESTSKIAFVGDVLFADGRIGRTDFSYSDPALLNASIQKLLALPKETVLYTGHGEPTTVARAQGV